MARGWGRSEEDQPGDREQARSSGSHSSLPSLEIERLKKRRAIELSLARIEDQLSKIGISQRRNALEKAREELRRALSEL